MWNTRPHNHMQNKNQNSVIAEPKIKIFKTSIFEYLLRLICIYNIHIRLSYRLQINQSKEWHSNLYVKIQVPIYNRCIYIYMGPDQSLALIGGHFSASCLITVDLNNGRDRLIWVGYYPQEIPEDSNYIPQIPADTNRSKKCPTCPAN